MAVVNALWLITAGKRMDYHDPEVRKIVDSLYNFFIDSAKPIANIGFQVRKQKIFGKLLPTYLSKFILDRVLP